MKQSDQKLLLLAALAGGGYYLYKKNKEATVSGVPGIMGVPGIGATLPNHSLVPASLRGQCSPWYMDAALWGAAGTALGYYVLGGKKLRLPL